MRILLIHQAFARVDEPGGTRHHEFARHLARAGHQITVLASPVSYLTGEETHRERSGRVEVDDLGVRIIRCPAYGGWHRSFLHRVLSFISFSASTLWQGLRLERPDVVWGTSPPLFQAGSAWLLARLSRARFLLEIRDLWPRFAVEVGVLRWPILVRLSEWLESFLYRRADLLVVNSPGFVDHVLERGGDQVAVIPNGVDLKMFSQLQMGADLRTRAGIPAGDFVLIYAGAHGMSNDLGVVLEAAERLRGHQQIQLVFLGDGKEKRALVQAAAQMRLENVRFLPAVPKEEMASMLSGADAGLAILKPLEGYKTTYPNKVFDYMAAGLPVILAIDGVIREVVEEAGAGVFVPPGEPEQLSRAIRELAQHRAEAAAMGERGRAYVAQHFARERLAAELEEQFIKLVQRNGL